MFLGAFTWWALAYHDGRDPRALGWFLVAYTAAATAGGVAWGARWVRAGEGFAGLSSGLAATRRAAGGSGPAAVVVGALVAVWLGGLAFDLFSGTRAWVDLAGAAQRVGTHRTSHRVPGRRGGGRGGPGGHDRRGSLGGERRTRVHAPWSTGP